MKQSNVIFGTLLLCFVIYITAKGNLPKYLALFKAKKSKDGGSSNPVKSFSNSLGLGDVNLSDFDFNGIGTGVEGGF